MSLRGEVLTRLGGGNGKLDGAGSLIVVALEYGCVDASELAQAVDGARVGGSVTRCDVDLHIQTHVSVIGRIPLHVTQGGVRGEQCADASGQAWQGIYSPADAQHASAGRANITVLTCAGLCGWPAPALLSSSSQQA